jgi:hypothetical protein
MEEYMIKFSKQATDVANESALHAWAEVNNIHIDNVLVRNIFKEVILYESYKYPTEEPVCAGFVIWDGKKKTVWLITYDDKMIDRKSADYKKLAEYAMKQTDRLLSMR